MLGKATNSVPLVTGYVVRGWAGPREVGEWGSAVAVQTEQTLYEVKDSRRWSKHGGHDWGQGWGSKWAWSLQGRHG